MNAYRVHTGYTVKGNDRWRYFKTEAEARRFCSQVFAASGLVLSIAQVRELAPARDRYWLREGTDTLEDARPFKSMRAAVDAYAETARDLARYEQSHDASIHLAPTWDEIVEDPDYVLSMGPRGGVRKERA